MLNAYCHKSYCRFCHVAENDRLSTPSYQRSTCSSRRRAIDTRNTLWSIAKGKMSGRGSGTRAKAISKKRIEFLDLPLELRQMIYSYSIRERSSTIQHVIHGRVRGGGYHPDWHAPRAAIRVWEHPDAKWRKEAHFFLLLHASAKVPTALLQVNRQINREAKRFMYNQIEFQIAPTHRNTMDQLRYWLNQHPIRFTSKLIIPFAIWFPTQMAPPVQRDQRLKGDCMARFAGILSKMPFLRNLTVMLVAVGEPDDDPVQPSLQTLGRARADRVLQQLETLRAGLKSGAELQVHFSAVDIPPCYLWRKYTLDTTLGYLHPLPKLLRVFGYKLEQNPSCGLHDPSLSTLPYRLLLNWQLD